MTECGQFVKEALPCNRQPGSSKCERKCLKGKCPSVSGECASRQKPKGTFFKPAVFFLREGGSNPKA
jgi:hypothetical protein